MFHLLLLSFDKHSIEKLYQLCGQLGDLSLYESSTIEQAACLVKQKEIHCVLLVPDAAFSETKRFLTMLRRLPQHQYTPVIILSGEYAHLLQLYPKWNRCEFFLLPLNKEREISFLQLLQFYQNISARLSKSVRKNLQLHTSQGVAIVPYDDILFIEIVLKKTILHTKDRTLAVALPLYKVRNAIECDTMVQTHRSFIVNLHNISFLDKSKNPWELSFFQSAEHAYVSRHYKQDFLHAISPEVIDSSH